MALVLALFLAATFVGGVATGLAGFAFGLVVSGVWLHIITPLQTASLIVGYGVFVQAYGIWALRHTFNWRHVIPLVIGVVVGAPIGAWLLHYTNPADLRFGVGLLLIAYAMYGLLRPRVKGVPANVPVELGVGLLNGLLGGMTGLAGVFVTIWCGMRGWSKDTQRGVYQPVILRIVRRHRALIDRRRRADRGIRQALLARRAGAARRHVARIQALWASQR